MRCLWHRHRPATLICLLLFVREVLTYISYFDTEFEEELLQVVSTETYDLHRLTEKLRECGFRLSASRASASESADLV